MPRRSWIARAVAVGVGAAIAAAAAGPGCSAPLEPRPYHFAHAPETMPTYKTLTGAWQRDWIRRGSAEPDAAVEVRYVQTLGVFGDVRIPGDRPSFAGATSFADLSDDQLAALAQQKGFAGTMTLDRSSATWHHEIDFQPTRDDDGPDVGRIEPTPGGELLEHALDGSYTERWSRLAPDDGKYATLRAVRFDRVDQILVIAGGSFVYARARPTTLPSADSLAELIVRGRATREQILLYLDCEVSFGTTRDWQIQRSTLPWREGTRLVLVDRIAIDATGQPAVRAQDDEVWTVETTGLAAGELAALFAAR